MPSKLTMNKLKEGLRKILKHVESRYQNMLTDLLDKIEEEEEEEKTRGKRLALRGLTETQIMNIFRLTHGQREPLELEAAQCRQVPDSLQNELKMWGRVTAMAEDGEAKMRSRLNIILFWAIDQTLVPWHQRWSSQPETVEADAGEIQGLRLRFETFLHYPVNWKGDKWFIEGQADYSLWYGDLKDYGSNLAFFEAKRKGAAELGIPQLLAYMGGLHHSRKQKGKANCIVYGVSSDGFDFIFVKISNRGEVTSFRKRWRGNEANDIYSWICAILLTAVNLSPSTTRPSMVERLSSNDSGFDFVIRENRRGGAMELMEVDE